MKSLSKLKNNKGMSLVELIISVAIVSIVIGVIFSFMVTGSKIFTASSSEITMQQDSQLVLNNIENRVLDAQLGAYFKNETDADSNPIFAKLTILNASGREYIYWDGNSNTVYYDSDTVDLSDLNAITEVDAAVLLNSGTKEVIAENVEKFFVEFKDTKINDGDEPKAKAYVQLTMKETDKTGKERGIESHKTISFRNKIDTSFPSEKQLYIAAEKELVDIKEVKVSPKSDIMFVPSGAGTTTQKKFTARVIGVGHPSQLVEWSIQDNPAGVSVDQNGVVTVTSDAVGGSITLRATAKRADGSLEVGEAFITLQKITGVTVSTQDKYFAGTFIKLQPALGGSEELKDIRFKKFTYTIKPEDGGNASDIQVYSEDNGMLYLGASTQGKKYTIRVTSEYDTSKYIDVVVDVQDTALVESGSGNAVAIRGDSVELLTSLSTTNLAENELNVSWEITDSAGLAGKVSVNRRGEFTVAKDVNYEKDYFVEVKATISASRLLNPVTKLLKVKIPAVTLHFTNTDGTIKKNSTETYKLEATGLVLAPEDVYVATDPALSNCIVYPTKDGVQVSVGKGNKSTQFNLIATLKNTNTSTSMKINITD